jgi:hypothetical protein
VRVLAALIASLYLPVGPTWSGIAPIGTKLLVTGVTATYGTCSFLVVDRATMKTRGPLRRACAKPPLVEHALVPVVGSTAHLFDVPVTLAGKVVFRYEDASDTRPQYAWYGRSLWIFDVATTDGPEALRFDAHTGALLQRTPMPKLYRPVMVANADGLWLDPATNGGVDGEEVASLFHVPFGASKPVVVHRGGRAALWIAASAHTVWFEQIAGRSRLSLWRVDGTRPRLLSRPKAIGLQGVYGNGRLWELTCGEKQRLLRIDPVTGTTTPVAQVPQLSFCEATLALGGGAVFILDPPELYRISP